MTKKVLQRTTRHLGNSKKWQTREILFKYAWHPFSCHRYRSNRNQPSLNKNHNLLKSLLNFYIYCESSLIISQKRISVKCAYKVHLATYKILSSKNRIFIDITIPKRFACHKFVRGSQCHHRVGSWTQRWHQSHFAIITFAVLCVSMHKLPWTWSWVYVEHATCIVR